MKRKIIGLIAVAAIALTMALNMNLNAKNNSLSDISLANVEALARVEEKGGEPCNDGWRSEVGALLRWCVDCQITCLGGIYGVNTCTE